MFSRVLLTFSPDSLNWSVDCVESVSLVFIGVGRASFTLGLTGTTSMGGGCGGVIPLSRRLEVIKEIFSCGRIAGLMALRRTPASSSSVRGGRSE